MHLPMRVGDYTDFFVGIHHASNVRFAEFPEFPEMFKQFWLT